MRSGWHAVADRTNVGSQQLLNVHVAHLRLTVGWGESFHTNFGQIPRVDLGNIDESLSGIASPVQWHLRVREAACGCLEPKKYKQS